MFTGNKAIDRGILFLNILALLGTIGVFVYKDFIYKRPLPDDFEEFAKLQEELKERVGEKSYKISKIVINLQSEDKSLHYLDLEVNLVPFKSHEVKYFEYYIQPITDAIIELAGSNTPSDLNTVTGKILFENQLKTNINKIIDPKKPTLKRIYFSKFVIN